MITAHRSEIERLCQLFGVTSLAVFGSILRGDFDADSSDIDFVVRFKTVMTLTSSGQYFDFKARLENLFGRKVDLVELTAMPNSRLKRIIERTQVAVYDQAPDV